MDENPLEWFIGLPERVAAARSEIAGYLHADPAHTALVPNASAGVTVVLANIPTSPGMEIVITDHTYGAVAMGAERLARSRNCDVRVARIPLDADATTATELVMAEVTERTALIVIDQITSATAREMPAGAVARAGRGLGVPVLVDAAHAPGLSGEPLDGIDADFWVGNLHKFACSPRGTAALIASGSLEQHLNPLIDSWGAPYPFPERFDHQGTVDVTAYLTASTSFDTIEQRYGWDAARAYMRSLGDYAETIISEAMSEATGFDARVDVGMPVNALRLIRLPELLATSPNDAAYLQHYLSVTAHVETAITSWHGEGFLRLSTHIYNTAEDYEDLAERVVPILVELHRVAQSGNTLYAQSSGATA
jgi:isopenicillin-N epimerase